jgi:GLPGLI family protein
MKIYIVLICSLFLRIVAIANDTTAYSFKYRYTKQKDSTNKNSKFDDIMILTTSKSYSLYYSYLRQLGYRKLDGDALKNDIAAGGMVNIDEGSAAKYFVNNESEVIETDYNKKRVKITDNFIDDNFVLNDTLIRPIWKIENDTLSILNQKCQKATTVFKGRNYLAWFTPDIPLNTGPWLFNGLPGLILRVQDSKGQFLFECIELNTAVSSTSVYKPYTQLQKISKKALKAKKKLYTQNLFAFMQAGGKTITISGQGSSNKIPDKPYNPIDLEK